jgi:ABC-type sugar transport system ATPase subunit
MRRELTQLFERQGCPFIYVTHDQIEAMTLATRIVVLSQGKIQQVGSPMDLYQQPSNRFVAGFLGTPTMNFLNLEQSEGKWRTEAGPVLALPVPGGHQGMVTLGIRPECLSPSSGEGGELVLEGKLERIEATGNLTFLYVAFGDQILVATVDPKRAREFTRGAPLGLDFQLEDARFFLPGEFGARLGF